MCSPTWRTPASFAPQPPIPPCKRYIVTSRPWCTACCHKTNFQSDRNFCAPGATNQYQLVSHSFRFVQGGAMKSRHPHLIVWPALATITMLLVAACSPTASPASRPVKAAVETTQTAVPTAVPHEMAFQGTVEAMTPASLTV